MSGLASCIPRAASLGAPSPPGLRSLGEVGSAARHRSTEGTHHAPQSKIKNPQSSFINPICRFGQIVLVQFYSMGDPENGGRFTVKKYHSAKTGTPPALPPDFSISAFQNFSIYPTPHHEGPEMVVVGEWIAEPPGIQI